MNESTQQIPINSQQTLQNASEIFSTGGYVMYILLGLSVIALTVILLKLFQFQYLNLFRKKMIKDAMAHWRNGEKQNAITIVSSSRHPISVVGLVAMRGLVKPHIDIDNLREEVMRVGNKQMNSLNKGLWSLELIAMVSPLLGLFGTVLGMIQAFKALQVAGAQVNPAILSGGIWQALLTTAAGLAVAIPVVMIFKWMERVINHIGEEMEDSTTQVFTYASNPKLQNKTEKNSSIASSRSSLSNA